MATSRVPRSKTHGRGKARRSPLKSASLPKLDERVYRAFRHSLPRWFRRHGRDLPWRHTKDPYAILVSELMLQQTQVATVLPYYERWLRQFPDWQSLALAQESEVIKAWEGLGYYRRARNLQRLSQLVLQEHDGRLPPNLESLRALPGIGPYTAAAVSSIAFGTKAAVVDGNVMRVLTRVFSLREDITLTTTQKMLRSLADELAPETGCGDYNEAIMELGATVCSPRKPQCLLCPLRKVCQVSDPEELPIKTRIAATPVSQSVAVIKKAGRWWCERPPEGQRLDALWRFPDLDPARMGVCDESPFLTFAYSITKYRVQLKAFRATFLPGSPPSSNSRQRWLSAREIEAAALASAHRRIWKHLQPDLEEGRSA